MGRSVRMVTGENGRPSIEWTGDSRWLHVSIGLLGQVGTMRALGPTLKLPDQVLTQFGSLTSSFASHADCTSGSSFPCWEKLSV